MSIEDELKAAFELASISNFKWLTDDEVDDLPPVTKKGSMTIPLNRETFEEMQAVSIFTGHWLTQARTVTKNKRKFRVTVRLYQIGTDEYIEANAVMIKPDVVDAAWYAIKEAGDFIMNNNKDADWDEVRCTARVKV